MKMNFIVIEMCHFKQGRNNKNDEVLVHRTNSL